MLIKMAIKFIPNQTKQFLKMHNMYMYMSSHIEKLDEMNSS